MRVLVIVVDGLRPAFLGPYGNDWVATPTLDRWAAAGVVFDGHFADCPEPEAFERAICSGRHPLAVAGAPADLFDDLAAAGVRVAHVKPSERDAEDALALRPAPRAVRRAIEELGDAPDALLWVEIDALLPPWLPSEEMLAELFTDESDDEDTAGTEPVTPWTDLLPDRVAVDDEFTFARLRQTYAAAVMELDAALEQLLKDCSKRGWGDDALRVLTSGRGFPLGEHEVVGYADSAPHEELVHLPLMMRWPGDQHAGLRVGALTQPMDLEPTLRELLLAATSETDHPLAGRSLIAAARGQNGRTRNHVISGRRQGHRAQWGLRSADWYLMLDAGAGTRKLFVKPDDRWEVNDMYQQHVEMAEEMERQLRAMIEMDRQSP